MVDSSTAFARADAACAVGAKQRVFDWDVAAIRIRESGATYAAAGLCGDWEWTGGDILRDGEPVPRELTYTYLSSNWAIPELCLDEDEFGSGEACWRWAHEAPGWDSGTYWPESALRLLRGEVPAPTAIALEEARTEEERS